MTTPQLRCVILAAGMGTRLGLPEPKPLAALDSATTILDRQLTLIRSQFGADVDITLVVGHLAEQFDFLGDTVRRVTNPRFASTNTSKSLLIALEEVGPGPVLWMNGDVVFERTVLATCVPAIRDGQSLMVVNQGETGDEEVKYQLADGFISQVGKNVSNAVGEAVGVNHVSAKDRDVLTQHLREADDFDYFEAAIDAAIARRSVAFAPVAITTADAIEVDTMEDFNVAQKRFGL
jgi:choline kinase